MFFLCVQKYFEKVEMMWSNFQKTRDARTSPSVPGGMFKKNHKKLPKIGKIAFLRPKNHPLKVSSATWAGVFSPPPVEWFRSETAPHLDFFFLVVWAPCAILEDQRNLVFVGRFGYVF